jgi:hypothetical protein
MAPVNGEGGVEPSPAVFPALSLFKTETEPSSSIARSSAKLIIPTCRPSDMNLMFGTIWMISRIG